VHKEIELLTGTEIMTEMLVCLIEIHGLHQLISKRLDEVRTCDRKLGREYIINRIYDAKISEKLEKLIIRMFEFCIFVLIKFIMGLYLMYFRKILTVIY